MRISDWSSDVCSSDLINPAKAKIIDIRVPVAFGSRVREFSLYAQHGPANGDVISNSQAIEQTIDRLIIPAIVIVDVTSGAHMIIADQAFPARPGAGGIGILRERWGGRGCGDRKGG